jgi:hypothetical protein
MNKFLASIATLFFSICAYAVTPTSESVETLLKLTNSQAMMDSTYKYMEQTMQMGMKQAGQNKPLSAEGQRVMDAFPSKFIAVMREEFNWEKMKPVFIKMYGETYDQEEIDGLIAFYSSPVGKSYLSKMPQLMPKLMGEMQSLMQSFMPKMKAAMDKAAEEAKAAK